jgi:hypothetical protein
MTEDHYRTLNVPPQASADEIQRAYRTLARRYHPDRNPLPQAALLMAVINQAYEVLGEPRKREAYDRKQNRTDGRIEEAVLLAARDTLQRQGWILSGTSDHEFVLRKGSRQVQVALVPMLDRLRLQQCLRQTAGFCVVLAVRIDPSIKTIYESVAVIDLMRSRLHAGDFPDSAYRDLFEKFL